MENTVIPFKQPCISLLIPVYREANGIKAIIRALEKLDYPSALLDVVLITEENDTLTRDAIAKAKLPPWMREISVPYGLPQTKPKAMNYAFHFARGDIVGIYDAEDSPHPQQLRKVVEVFQKSAPSVACVQARLGYYNAPESWLTRCFAIEYAIWFDVLIKGIRALDLPIPLGGTSVFFRKQILEELGKWDASNVTEDADLGMRLYRKGYRTELVDCLTLEEAPCKVSHWITQRSRWLKGFLQSWMTCLRQPRLCLKELGFRGFIGMNLLLLGAVLSFLAQPLFWGTALLWALTDVSGGRENYGRHWNGLLSSS
jgi:glycosyltransferase XagB